MWRFYCNVDWSKLVSAAESCREAKNNPLKKWTMHLCMKYGEDFSRWPAHGCGAKFTPWKRGESQVAELRLDDGTWTAFSADRMPTELDDEIKRVHAEFFKASQFVTPDDLKYVIPMTFPMTNVLEGDDFVGIARYPIDQWMANGEPKITVTGWIKLCIKIATKDTMNLDSVLKVGEKLLSKM